MSCKSLATSWQPSDSRGKMNRSDSVLWQKPSYQQKSPKKSEAKIQKRYQNFDYTAIADRLRVVSWSNDSSNDSKTKTIWDSFCPLFINTFVYFSPVFGKFIANISICRYIAIHKENRRNTKFVSQISWFFFLLIKLFTMSIFVLYEFGIASQEDACLTHVPL